MDGGNDADEEIEPDEIALLKGRRQRFPAYAGDAHLAVWLVGKPVVQVVEQLTVNAHRLHAVQHRVSGSL